MQGKFQTFSEYAERTDKLAARLSLNLSDLPEIIGTSRPMLYSYRSGKNRITPKAWHKLEVAERAAGIDSQPTAAEPSPDENAESKSKLNEDLVGYEKKPAQDPTMAEAMAKLGEAIQMLEALLKKGTD